MRVRATRLGYHNLFRRKEGVIFDIKDESEFSSRWMEYVDGKPSQVTPVNSNEVAPKPKGKPRGRHAPKVENVIPTGDLDVI